MMKDGIAYSCIAVLVVVVVWLSWMAGATDYQIERHTAKMCAMDERITAVEEAAKGTNAKVFVIDKQVDDNLDLILRQERLMEKIVELLKMMQDNM